MRVLLVQPETPKTYWSFHDALPFVAKKAALPPLGLASLAALLPATWELRIHDANLAPLRDADFLWADTVFLTGMLVHGASMHEILRRAKALGRRTVVGGPAVNTAPETFPEADHVFRGEAEGRLELLVAALEERRRVAPRLLSPPEPNRPDMATVPVPRFDLLDHRQYISMSLQYSRGCPFHCDFCDITAVFGRAPRVKTAAQVLAELDALDATGYRGTLFFVDDNFIGNRRAVAELLPRLTQWQRAHDWPFELYTEASVDLASEPALLAGLRAANFTAVFLGLETPSAASLKSVGKHQNLRLDPSEAVRRITAAGLEVYAGFIVGFDTDGQGIFRAQDDFISALPIPTAMVGLLSAVPGTALWDRLKAEGRLRTEASGDQFDRPNFTPALDEAALISGYDGLLRRLYAADAYYARCRNLMETVGESTNPTHVRKGGVAALLRACWRIGVLSSRRANYWRLVGWTLLHRPKSLARAVTLAIVGEHLIRYTDEHVGPRLAEALTALRGEQAEALTLPAFASAV